MSTRSNIIVQRKDGKWSRIYCHWDGYPEHHGPILLGHYNSLQLASLLVKAGDLSILAERCDKPAGHSFDSPKAGHCVYYGRDRGEEGTEKQVFENLNAAWPGGDTGAEFVYVWQDGQWWVGDADQGSQSLKPLAEVMTGKTEAPQPAIKAFGGNFVVGLRKKGRGGGGAV